MAEFNADLHAFLLENEMCMGTERGELRFGVHVYFEDIPELIKLLGESVLDDGGIDCNLNNSRTLYVPLEDYFLNCNYTVRDFKYCFDEYDIKNYAPQIEKFDKDS